MRILLPVVFLMLCCHQAQAAPALYYQWMSKLDGSRVCSQVPLGEGWKRVGGPFKDSRCRKPA
jgi:hypothetical protein